MPQPAQSPAPLNRDPALDGLRGVAVLLVFLFHYGGGLRAHNPLLRAFGYLTQAGWIGVDLFFALSGFLITGILADAIISRPSTAPLGAGGPATGTWVPNSSPSSLEETFPQILRNFYVRRALRILPLYFLALLACAAAALLSGAPVLQLEPLLIYAAFLQNLPPLVSTALHTPPPLPVFHLWSLAVEEQFYLLWPLALLAARTPRRALHLSLYTFATSCLFRAFVFAPHLFPWATASSFATFLPTRAGALALGSALALYRPVSPIPNSTSSLIAARPSPESQISSRVRARSTGLPPRILFTAASLSVGVILLTSLYTRSLLLNSRPAFLFTLPAADLFSALLVALALNPNLLRRTLSMGPLILLGRISYGFYVFHILLEPLFDHMGNSLLHTQSGFPYQVLRFVAGFVITTAAAWLSYTVLERPFLRLKQRFPRTSPSAA